MEIKKNDDIKCYTTHTSLMRKYYTKNMIIYLVMIIYTVI